MSNKNAINPYSRLLAQIQQFIFDQKYCHKRTMFSFSRDEGVYSVQQVYERTKAADALGYDVQIVAKEDGLIFQYVKRVDVPWGWR